MKKKGEARAEKVLCGSAGGGSETPIGRATAPRTFLESTAAILRACGNRYRKLQTRLRNTPIRTTSSPAIFKPQKESAHPLEQPPSMESESDHDHRDDESVSEQEEIEDTKPKSALKKTRDVLPPVERPELP